MLDILIADGTQEQAYIKQLKNRQAGGNPSVVASVQEIIERVRAEGDAALRFYNEKFDGVSGPIKILSKADIEEACQYVDDDLVEALENAAENIRQFHLKQRQEGYIHFHENGSMMGQIVRPLSKVGLYVPGGTASYPSSVLMNAIPAKIAGVDEIILITPPSGKGNNDRILAAAAVAGVDKVYLVGGAHGVAALAYGTETIPAVDKIVGPGNIYVATAKKLLFGTVDIDMIAGPSEILVIADGSANPAYVAADLLSQCEHDEQAAAILITDSLALAEEVKKEIGHQSKALSRLAIVQKSLENYGKAIVVPTIERGIEISNTIAPEHLELLVQDAEHYMGNIRNAGSIFLGPYTPEAVGDYYAGVNHVLPTGGTARFFSPLGVQSFIKRMSFTKYSREALAKGRNDIMTIAQSEGLTAHANAIKVRDLT